MISLAGREGIKIEELFKRYSGNPIISVKSLPYQANSVFNTGVTKFGNETLLLMRVEDRRGMSHLTVARSSNGVDGWNIDKKPTFLPVPDKYPEEIWGIEDPRITFVEEIKKWVIVYTAYSQYGPLVAIAKTKDFKDFERIGPILPPENKDAAIFPVRFGGRWVLIHRPVTLGRGIGRNIWISYSPDMKHWGDHRVLIPCREGGWWDANKIGLSPPPLQTKEGWLVLYHGVRETGSGSIYRLGLALLDRDNPEKVICRSNEWVFSPREYYERAGDVDDVLFPCGWIVEGDEVKLYYGCADTCIGLATAKLSELLDWLKRNNG